VYALLSVVSSVHDVLLEKRIPPALSLPPHPFVASGTPARAPEPSLFGAPPPPPPSRVTPLLPAPSEHTRYTRYWTTRSPAYRRAARALTTLTYVELLLEMVAKKRVSERARWRLVLGIESFK
jgi:peroxin-16